MTFKTLLESMKKIDLCENPVENIQFTDEPKIPAYLTYPNKKAIDKYETTEVGGQGYALNKMVARVKSVAEFLERLCIYNPLLDVLSPPAKFEDNSEFVDPTTFHHTEMHDDKGAEILRSGNYRWVKGKDIFHDKNVLVPAQLVYLTDIFSNEMPIQRETTTNGAAFGLSENNDSVERGLLELVERDACMYSYLSERRLSRIIEFTEDIEELLGYLNRYRLETYVFDCATDLGIPTVIAITIDKTGVGPAVNLGSSAKLNYKDAIKRSILESIQCRNYARFMRKKDKESFPNETEVTSLENRLYYWYPPERIQDLDFWLQDSQQIKFSEISNKTATFANVISEFKNKGFDIIVVDITLPEIAQAGFKCSKVMVPQLHPLYLDERSKVLYSDHYGLLDDGGLKPHPFA